MPTKKQLLPSLAPPPGVVLLAVMLKLIVLAASNYAGARSLGVSRERRRPRGCGTLFLRIPLVLTIFHMHTPSLVMCKVRCGAARPLCYDYSTI